LATWSIRSVGQRQIRTSFGEFVHHREQAKCGILAEADATANGHA
jgi:hypothetical protein